MLRTFVGILAFAALLVALWLAVSGKDPFYPEAVYGKERIRGVALWALGAVALWVVAGLL